MLVRLIRLYRAHLTGRGPFRRCRCTFEGTESCSAYGLRVAQEAGSLSALRLIRARLRRCRGAAIYRGDGVWMWGRLYDAGGADALVATLRAAGESPESCELVIDSARMIRGERPQNSRPLLRDGAQLRAWLRARLARRVLAWVALSAALALAVGPLGLLTLGLAIGPIRRAIDDARRFDQQRAAGQFLGQPLADFFEPQAQRSPAMIT